MPIRSLLDDELPPAPPEFVLAAACIAWPPSAARNARVRKAAAVPARPGRLMRSVEEPLTSAGLFVSPVRTAVRAELLHLQAVRVVAPVLLGDVVAVLAVFARQRDLGSHVSGSHSISFSLKIKAVHSGPMITVEKGGAVRSYPA